MHKASSTRRSLHSSECIWCVVRSYRTCSANWIAPAQSPFDISFGFHGRARLTPFDITCRRCHAAYFVSLLIATRPSRLTGASLMKYSISLPPQCSIMFRNMIGTMWASVVEDTDICKLLCQSNYELMMIPSGWPRQGSVQPYPRAIYRGTLRYCAGAAETQKDDRECWVNFVH